LDENPKVCVYPVEESSYLEFKMYESEEGFQQNIESLYKKFMDYINVFNKECINSNAIQTHLRPTLARIISEYKNAEYRFTHSPLRLEWKNYSQYYAIANAATDFNIAKEQKYTREAYSFFYKVYSIQLSFIKKIIEEFTLLLKANGFDPAEHHEAEIEQPIEYKKLSFVIQPSASIHSHNILKYIHKKLNDKGYIDCPQENFIQIFTSEEPHPIIWLKDYIHLTYLMKKMTGRFLKRTRSPSVYDVARDYFFNKKYGVFFNPKIVRHQKDPKNKKDKAFLDEVINGSIQYFLEN